MNLDGNVEFGLCLKRNKMYDYNLERSDYENWIPFTLYLNLPNRRNMIKEKENATMTVLEIKNLIQGIESVMTYLNRRENYIYTFNSLESFFELKLEVIPEDDVIEFEVWINVGTQSNGEIYGFDEGVRFATSGNELNDFLEEFKRNYLEVKRL